MLVHAGALVLAFVSGYVIQDGHLLDKAPHVMEVVAGPGDDYMATEAPALGTPGGQKIEMPKAPDPVVRPAAPQPEPEAASQPQPEEASPVTAAPVEAVPVPKPKKEVPISKQIEKIAARREAKIVKKFRKEQEAREKAEAKARELEAKRLSAAEYKASLRGGKGARIDADGIADGVAGGTSKTSRGAGGKALTAEQKSELEGYFAYLVQKIKNAHVTPEGVNARLKVKIQFMCLANGALSAVKIVESSGDADFDRSVVDAVRAVGSVGRPRPDGKSDVVTLPVSMTEGD